MGAEIGEMMCSRGKSGGSSLRTCIFIIQANKMVLI
jgi:hypothetical protein